MRAPAGRSFYIENLGCAKNQVDAETLRAQLEQAGWFWTEEPARADVVLVNTCAFIRSAKVESINTLYEMRAAFPKAKLVACGCLSQRYGNELLRLFPELDAVIGNRNTDTVAEGVLSALQESSAAAAEKCPLFTFRDPSRPVVPNLLSPHRVYRRHRFSPNGSAFVKISEGCRRRCAFCAIPHIRGDVYSRSIADITDEIKALLDDGTVEINLVAQNLFDYGNGPLDRFDSLPGKAPGESNLVFLLKQIFAVDRPFVVRLLYMHPDTFDSHLIDLMAHEPRLLPYLDIPFQHASAPLLRAMNRSGSAESYLELIQRLRAALPSVVIRSTFMLGFPGERRSDRLALLDFVRRAQLDWAGFFVYSREENTPAFRLTGPLRNAVTVHRANRWLPKVQSVQEAITESRLQRRIGQELPVLIEEAVEGADLFLGRAYLQAPEVDGAVVVNAGGLTPGQVVPCKIIRISGVDLEAVVVS